MDDLTTVGAWLLSSLLGGGVVAAAGYAFLKDKLIRDFLPIFAKRSELDGVGGKVTGAISMATMAKDTADNNSDAIIRLQEADRHRWEPVANVLERLDSRLDQHEQAITRVTTVLDEITRRLDRQDNNRR